MSRRERRLAAIVAADIVGYSALTERDADAAASAVDTVRAAIEACAARHDGRLFNTAGDGFMIEFSKSRDAFAFCVALLRALEDGPSLRIGADLGEVLPTPTGDLLGHGVNVSARLMDMAEPRGLLASEAFRAPLSRRLARLFVPHGPVHLDKMRTTIDVFVLARQLGPLGRIRLAMRRPWRAAMGIAAAAGLAALLFWAGAPRDQTPMIAVLPFDAADTAEGRRMAEGVADDIIMTLAREPSIGVASRASSFELAGLDPREAAQRLGARFVLDGVVREEAGQWRVDAHFVDARSNRTLWAERFETPDAHASALQRQIAQAVLGAVSGVVAPQTAQGADLPADAYALFLEGRAARQTRQPAQVAFAIGVLRQVTETAPAFARGWSELAGAQLIRAGHLLRGPDPDASAAADMRAQSRASAERALALDPRDGYALAVLAGLEPPGHWAEARALLDRAVAAAPSDANVLRARGVLLSDIGYLDLAMADLERARALDPLNAQIALIWTLEAVGGRARARTLLTEAGAAHPAEAWNTQLLFALFDRDIVAARALLDSPDRPDMDPGTLARWTATLQALASRRPAQLAAARAAWREHAAAQPARAEDAVLMLALLGAPDEAFATAQAAAAAAESDDPFQRLIFRADLAAAQPVAFLTRDPRYFELMREGGLTEYWRAAGTPPFFCRAAPSACREGA